MSGLDSSRRQSATRRFSPPERTSTLASHGGQAQRIGRDLELRVERRGVRGGEQLLQLLLLGGELVEVRIGLRVFRVDLLEALLRGEDLAQALLHRLAHGVAGFELRLLRQVADADSGHRGRLAFVLLVDARHDAQHGGLARAIEPQQADLGAGVERDGDVLDDLALGRNDLAHADHGIDVLRHGNLWPIEVLQGRREDTSNQAPFGATRVFGSPAGKPKKRPADFSRRPRSRKVGGYLRMNLSRRTPCPPSRG
jgi:hypothetical protein